MILEEMYNGRFYPCETVVADSSRFKQAVKASAALMDTLSERLSKEDYEKETIINWNEAENLASVYTFNASLKRRLADFSRKYPLLCRLERSTPEGSVTYVLDKSRLSIRLVPPYSEERKAAAREYAKEHGFQVVGAGEKIA